MRRNEIAMLALLLLGYLIVGTLYAARTPAWQVPDEPAHYNYVAQVAREGCCPTLEMGDWDSAYLDAIKANGFKPPLTHLETIRYENHQPPLYYLLAAPIFKLTGGSLLALRLFSVFLGALLVIVCYTTVRGLFSRQPFLALGAAGFLAFLPQHLAMMGGVNNDSLAELLIGLILLASLRFLSAPESRAVHPALLGILLGLAFITKATAYGLVAVVGLAVLMRGRRERWPLRRWLQVGAWVLIPALILGGIWWLRDFSVYGFPDFLGLRRHDSVVVGQPRTADTLAQIGSAAYLNSAVQTTFRSFWGQFGWMGVVMPDGIVRALALLSGFLTAGAALAVARFRRQISRFQWEGLLLLALLVLIAAAQFIYYNLTFEQLQGRYLFPALIPFGLWFAGGLAGWLSLVPDRRTRWLVVAAPLLLGLFALYALFRILIPALPNWG